MARYGFDGFNFVMDLNFKEGFEQILKAADMVNEDRIYQRWLCSGLGYENKISFDEFMLKSGYKSRLKEFRHPTEVVTKEKALEKVKNILSMKERGTNG